MGKSGKLEKRIGVVAVVILLAALAQGMAWAEQVRLNVALANPVLMADRKQTTYLKVGLTGGVMESLGRRAPVNVAIVLDRSGSMAGEKIEKAKQAAIMAVERLNSDDIVSVVAYDDVVNVLVPATRASDKYAIESAIGRLYAGNTTALFAGVCKGAQEVRKFLDRGRVNRIVFLSDGLANVGPSSPWDLGALGASLAKEGITISTFGLGLDYNEDLMAQLAGKSDGMHVFLRTSEDIARFFNYELGNILSVVAQGTVIRIECAEGVRPVRAIGRDADISGNTVIAALGHLYSEQPKNLLIEVEVPAAAPGVSREIAKVSVSYANMQTKLTDHLQNTVAARFTDSEEMVARETNSEVMVSVVERIATESNDLAVTLRDQGRVDEAREVLRKNAAYLGASADKYKAESLRRLKDLNVWDSQNLDGEKWQRGRKEMRDQQRQFINDRNIWNAPG